MKRPNILFIVSDQMVAELTSAYGHPLVQTPHLSRLAEEGVEFTASGGVDLSVYRWWPDELIKRRHR